MKAYQIQTIRVLFKILNVLAPSYAAELSEKLFLTPMVKGLRKKDEDFLVKAEQFKFKSGDYTLQGYKWGGDSLPKILLVHGWCSNSAAYRLLIPELLKKGYQVVAFDGPAHGSSSGERAMLTIWADSIISIMNEIGEVSAIVGHSLGGAGILIASQFNLETKKIVLISPLGDIVWATHEFADTLGISRKVIKKMRENAWNNYIESASKYGDNWNDVFLSNFKVPSLIIHDKNDNEISWEQGHEISLRWNWAEFVTTHNLGHRKILRDEQVLNKIVDFCCEEK